MSACSTSHIATDNINNIKIHTNHCKFIFIIVHKNDVISKLTNISYTTHYGDKCLTIVLPIDNAIIYENDDTITYGYSTNPQYNMNNWSCCKTENIDRSTFKYTFHHINTLTLTYDTSSKPIHFKTIVITQNIQKFGSGMTGLAFRTWD